jgi:hypothetical protein
MKQDLALRALSMAIAIRRPPPGCIHHYADVPIMPMWGCKLLNTFKSVAPVSA